MVYGRGSPGARRPATKRLKKLAATRISSLRQQRGSMPPQQECQCARLTGELRHSGSKFPASKLSGGIADDPSLLVVTAADAALKIKCWRMASWLAPRVALGRLQYLNPTTPSVNESSCVVPGKTPELIRDLSSSQAAGGAKKAPTKMKLIYQRVQRILTSGAAQHDHFCLWTCILAYRS